MLKTVGKCESEPMLPNIDNIIIIDNNNDKFAKRDDNYITDGIQDSNKKEIEMFWQKLSYSVNDSPNKSLSSFKSVNKRRKIIHNLNGNLVSGNLTAILGPNGAGKSTLLECLAGRRKSGLSGDIFVTYKGFTADVKFSYYSQKDFLIDVLTVEESLLFASQLKYWRKKTRINDLAKQNDLVSLPTESHSHSYQYFNQMKVKKLINDLHLEKCAKTSVRYCSGGQKRRLSIALELIFSPSILLLDEPTSGLDSLSTLHCIELLKQLSQNKDNPMIIAMVIHQPTARLLSFFDKLYIVSSTGQCIYNGMTSQLIPTLSQFNLQCPQFHNPSDFAVEIASGDYGLNAIELLANYQKGLFEDRVIDKTNCIEMSKVLEKTQKHSIIEQLLTVWVLSKRCFLINIRDPKQYLLQLFAVIFMISLLYVIHWDYKIGTNDGCLQRPTFEYFKSMFIFDVLNPTSSPFPNWAFIFYSLLFTVLMSMLPTLLSFPLQVTIFSKEHSNGWYSLSSYFLAKNIADIPPNLIFPVMYCIGSYFITDQILDIWRLFGFTFIITLLAFLTQGLGFFISALFVNNIIASTVIGAIVNVPLILFAGFLIKIQTIPAFFRPFTLISYFRLTFESIMLVLYGFNRCQPIEKITISNLRQEFGDHIIPMFKCIDDYDTGLYDNVTIAFDFFNGMVEKSNSFALQAFEYQESDLLFNIFYLIIYAIVLRILAYILLIFQTKVK